MKRSNSHSPNFIFPQDLLMRASFHEAGHAVAIYLYNREQGLPPVYFSIKFSNFTIPAANHGIAGVEGGRLIQALPSSWEFLANSSKCGDEVKNAFLMAFEADVVNYLCGPIAEAKYASGNTDEAPLLSSPEELLHYGGAFDLKIVDNYMNSRFERKTDKAHKITELFERALEFVNNAATWQAISTLAQHIRETSKQSIDCEEAITVIDRCMAAQQPMPIAA